jgi:hypothetical protein
MIQLGSTVTEAISGFTGIASGRCEYLTGCTQILVQPIGLDKDGKKRDGLWLDEQRLTVDKKKKLVTFDNAKTPGFDKPAPIR